MSKQKIEDWLVENTGYFYDDNRITMDETIDIIHQYTQEQSGWVSVDAAKPEGPIAVDGFGFIVGGYGHGDQSRWTDIFYDTEKDAWWYWGEDMERVDITGFTITHWARPSLPPAEEA